MNTWVGTRRGLEWEKDTDCWVWIRQEALVSESDEEGGLSHSGVACRAQYMNEDEWGMERPSPVMMNLRT